MKYMKYVEANNKIKNICNSLLCELKQMTNVKNIPFLKHSKTFLKHSKTFLKTF